MLRSGFEPEAAMEGEEDSIVLSMCAYHFFKVGQPWPLFRLFTVFQINNTILQQISVK